MIKLTATALLAAVVTTLTAASAPALERAYTVLLTCDAQKERCFDLLWADKPEDQGSFQGIIEWIEAREDEGYRILGPHCLDLDEDGEVIHGPGIETMLYDDFAEIIEQIGGLEGCCIDVEARMAQLAAAFECPEIDLDALRQLWAEMVFDVAGCDCRDPLFGIPDAHQPPQ